MVWLLWTAVALAGDPAADARSAVATGDVRGAREAVEALDAALGRSREEVRTEALAFRFQIEGAVADLRSRDAEMMAAFRASWVVAPTGRPDPSALSRSDLVRAYKSVQSEVFQSAPVSLDGLRLPAAPVRIDGQEPGAQPVFKGRHHVQVQCADGSWSSRWSSLSRPEDWGHACPDGALAPLAAAVAPAPGTPTAVLEPPVAAGGGVDQSPGPTPGPADPAPTEAPPSSLPADASIFERGVQWVRDFELPRSPKGRLLLGGPTVGLGTGAELQFVPGGDSGGVFTTVSVAHLPIQVSAERLELLRLSAGELGVGWQPARKGAPGAELKGGLAVYHDTLRYTDGYLYLSAAAGARWDAPGPGGTAFLGVQWVGNYARMFVGPRAAVGWQF